MAGNDTGTLIVAVGPPGSGKSYAVSALAFQVAYSNNLPFIGIDPGGEIAKYAEGFILNARESGDDEALSWLTDEQTFCCLKVDATKEQGDKEDDDGMNLWQAVRVVQRLQTRLMTQKVTEPSCVIYMDELAWIREKMPQAQDGIISKLRNVGALGFGTCQTEVGMTTKARACSRGVIAYKTTKGGIELFGKWFDNSLLGDPQSDDLVCIVPWTGECVRFNLNGEIPELLTTPVSPTGLVKRSLKRVR